MDRILSVSWKNVWRNKKRSLIVISAVMLGTAAGVFTSGLMNGWVDQRIRSVINIEQSHIKIYNPEFLKNEELTNYIKGVAQVENYLETNNTIKGYSKRIKIMSLAATSRGNTALMLVGVDPDNERIVSELYNHIVPDGGEYLENGKSGGILISDKTAETLRIKNKESGKYKLRSKIVLTFTGKEGEMISQSYRVCGVYKTSNTAFDQMYAFVLDKELRSAIPLAGNEIHEIAVILNDNDDLISVQNDINKRFPQISALNWMELAPDAGMMSEYMYIYYVIIMGFILFALAFGIINTMLMAILERGKEIGMLMAIGMNKSKVFKMIMLETVFLTMVGAVVGMAVGWILITITGKTGIDFSSVEEGFEALGWSSVVYPNIPAGFFFGVTLMVVLTGITASLLPARKALRMNPVEALRTDN
ncbi:MAG: FtsX-like permease family protein [Rikenellaceae bacterium]|nr:FtsX-like permease family protein [Rikenellaceae bacterium]